MGWIRTHDLITWFSRHDLAVVVPVASTHEASGAVSMEDHRGRRRAVTVVVTEEPVAQLKRHIKRHNQNHMSDFTVASL